MCWWVVVVTAAWGAPDPTGRVPVPQVAVPSQGPLPASAAVRPWFLPRDVAETQDARVFRLESEEALAGHLYAARDTGASSRAFTNDGRSLPVRVVRDAQGEVWAILSVRVVAERAGAPCGATASLVARPTRALASNPDVMAAPIPVRVTGGAAVRVAPAGTDWRNPTAGRWVRDEANVEFGDGRLEFAAHVPLDSVSRALGIGLGPRGGGCAPTVGLTWELTKGTDPEIEVSLSTGSDTPSGDASASGSTLTVTSSRSVASFPWGGSATLATATGQSGAAGYDDASEKVVWVHRLDGSIHSWKVDGVDIAMSTSSSPSGVDVVGAVSVSAASSAVSDLSAGTSWSISGSPDVDLDIAGESTEAFWCTVGFALPRTASGEKSATYTLTVTSI